VDLTTEILLRPGEPGDTNLILHNWLREGYKSTFARTFGHEVWNREHERFLRENVLPRSAITVAADATMPDVVCAHDARCSVRICGDRGARVALRLLQTPMEGSRDCSALAICTAADRVRDTPR